MSEKRKHRGKSEAPVALATALCLALLLFALWPAPASAHGASVVQEDDDVGPYHIVAVTGPATLSGDLLLTVVLSPALSSAEPSPVTGATIKAKIEVSGTTLVVSVPPEASRASSGYYETTVNIPGDEDAKVSLEIDGAQGKVSVPFTIKRPAAWVNWLTLGAEVLVSAMLICLLVFTANKLRHPRAGDQSGQKRGIT